MIIRGGQSRAVRQVDARALGVKIEKLRLGRLLLVSIGRLVVIMLYAHQQVGSRGPVKVMASLKTMKLVCRHLKLLLWMLLLRVLLRMRRIYQKPAVNVGQLGQLGGCRVRVRWPCRRLHLRHFLGRRGRSLVHVPQPIDQRVHRLVHLLVQLVIASLVKRLLIANLICHRICITCSDLHGRNRR